MGIQSARKGAAVRTFPPCRPKCTAPNDRSPRQVHMEFSGGVLRLWSRVICHNCKPHFSYYLSCGIGVRDHEFQIRISAGRVAVNNLQNQLGRKKRLNEASSIIFQLARSKAQRFEHLSQKLKIFLTSRLGRNNCTFHGWRSFGALWSCWVILIGANPRESGARSYLPLNCAGRFSRNAVVPSFLSSVAQHTPNNVASR